MAIDLITGHQGVAHISAEQIAELQRAELGGYGDNKVMRMIDGGVTYAGLTITVAAGYWRVNGYDMQIQEAEEILIDPTAAGMSRIDKVYAAILQDIPSGVQRSELRVVQGEESASTPTAPTKPTAPILNTDELLQIEEVCTVTVSDGAMTFTDNTIPYELANPEDITDTQEMIAPIEAGPTASKAYAVGKQLIYNGLLYKVTAAIAQGDTLTVGTNIELSDDVVTQLETLTKNVPKYGTSSSSASTTSKTATTTNGDFNLHTGSVVRVKFTYTNTATTPTLNVDSTGAHAIKAYNTTKPDVYWKAGDVVEFTYDGTNFIMGPTEGQITDLNASLTHIGMIIHSTTLDTEAKVKAIYGSNTSWIQHSGYVLRGAASGVTANSATKTGGDDNAYLIKHTHSAVMNAMSSYQGYFTITGAQNNGNPNSGFASTSQAGTVDNGTNRNIPNYKSVYIWERIA